MEVIHGTIMVVDDTELNRVMLSNWLKEQGHQVILAKSGRQALELLPDAQADLILLDILMPEMDGYEVLERLKADVALRQIPVIVISAVDELDSIVKCIELGAEDYLFKPFNVITLKARIKASLEKRRLRQQEDSHRQQLMATQRLASLGTLAAGVAHELNSPLQVITGVSETLLISLEKGQTLEPEVLRDRLDAIKRNAWRCAEISAALRTYAQVSTEPTETQDVNALMHDALLLMESQWHDQTDIRIVTRFTPDMPPMPCDRNAIMQALMNLLSNAHDALPHGGEIHVSTDYEPERRQFCIMVTDTGIGISEAARARIFDPFFTTKPLGEGTGLGLSILSGIVSTHGGRIEVDSAPGQGATFSLYFPQDRPLSPSAGTAPLVTGARFDDTIVSWP